MRFLKNFVIVLVPFFLAISLSHSQIQADNANSNGDLEIHYINVGQGGSTLIIGPNGTRILYDFGNKSGTEDIVPYLRKNLDSPQNDFVHFTIVSHRDRDHYFGFKDFKEAGIDVLVANYGPGSPKPETNMVKNRWLTPAKETTAGKVRPIPLGLNLSLGNGAEAFVIAANGKVFGENSHLNIKNENDRSVSLFINYGNFQYILDGDIGSGQEICTDHQTSQKDVQTRVAQALIRLGKISPTNGVDVLHIAHHGSESSTSAAYYNLMKPEVGLISVGLNQSKVFCHPREDVVNKVLLRGDKRASCLTAPPLKSLFQTEDGKTLCSATTGKTSNSGLSMGDIKLVTDGKTNYRIIGNNRVHGGDKEATEAQCFDFDENNEESKCPGN
jgi:competence protein ComEC